MWILKLEGFQKMLPESYKQSNSNWCFIENDFQRCQRHTITESDIVCALPSLLLIYIPPSFHSGYHGSKELDSNSAAVGWNLSRVVGDDRHCLREMRCGRTHCDMQAAAMAAAAAATHALSYTSSEGTCVKALLEDIRRGWSRFKRNKDSNKMYVFKGNTMNQSARKSRRLWLVLSRIPFSVDGPRHHPQRHGWNLH